MLNVVILNGGRGAATLIPALQSRQGLHVTSVVNAYDDGKSTGEIRKFFGMLGPSDIRKVQQLMLPKDDPHYESHLALFEHRYPFDCQRDYVLSDLNKFACASSDTIAGITLENPSVIASLRTFILQFLDALRLVEQVQNRRFNFSDCSLMNCFYAGAFLFFHRSLEEATKAIDRLFRLRGIVLPTSNDNLHLVAMRENGEILYSESEVVELRSNVRIDRIYLLDHHLDRKRFEKLSVSDKRSYLLQHHCKVNISPGVLLSIKQADIIIYSAGTQHSSLYPTYMAAGLASAIAENLSSYKVFISNIGADYETPSYKASDYLLGAYQYLTLTDAKHRSMRELINTVLINQSNRKPDDTYVIYNPEGFSGLEVNVQVGDFESSSQPGKHDGDKLTNAILGSYLSMPMADA